MSNNDTLGIPTFPDNNSTEKEDMYTQDRGIDLSPMRTPTETLDSDGPTVKDLLTQQNDFLDRLDNAINRLNEKLIPLLKDDVPVPASGNNAIPAMAHSPLGRTLETNNARLYMAVQTIDSLVWTMDA